MASVVVRFRIIVSTRSCLGTWSGAGPWSLRGRAMGWGRWASVTCGATGRTGPWRLWSGAVTVVSTDLVDLDLSSADLKLGRGRGRAMGLL